MNAAFMPRPSRLRPAAGRRVVHRTEEVDLRGMIGVEEAKRIIMRHVPLTDPLELFTDQAIDHWLADDIRAGHDHPRFDMSAVDGFAVNGGGATWSVVDAIAAGRVMRNALGPGQCARIFTGAAVPQGTDAIVMQEHGRHADGRFDLTGALPAPGSNIRRKGEGFARGALLLRSGERIDAPAVGVLASDGHLKVRVRARPEVAVLRTGGEFAEDDAPEEGRIFSSNDHMLLAALMREGICDHPLFTAMDDAEDLRADLEEAIAGNDLVITTGGVSVGDHDLMERVLRELGATVHFHGVSQKPGKPMLFATLNGQPLFALPGNPRAVMVLFWEYVLPFLRAMQGANMPWLKSDRLKTAHEVRVKGGRAEFRAARLIDGRVTLLPDEGSHLLGSLVNADALAYLPATQREWNEGDAVEVHLLPR